jgi:hypothetical protein
MHCNKVGEIQWGKPAKGLADEGHWAVRRECGSLATFRRNLKKTQFSLMMCSFEDVVQL